MLVKHLRALALSFAAFIASGASAPAQTNSILVFAAASLKDGLDDAARAYRAAGGVDVRISYAGSLALARQLEQRAPADIFIAADQESMDYAASRNAIRQETRFDFLQNRLVVVAARSAPFDALALTSASFSNALGSGRLVTGDVKSVPAGKYAMAALQTLGLWRDLEPRLAMADNVRAALVFVSRGEAPLGVVYATDAAAEPGVKTVAIFPPESHPPIVYPVALTAHSANASAAAFLAYLRSPAGRAHFEKQGFAILP